MNFYFNECLINKVFFGCGIIELKDQKDRILRKMNKTIIAIKLRLGSNFPKAALCLRKNTLGIGLINPKTAVSILVCKLCIENLRVNTKISKIRQTQEESLIIEY